MSNPASSEAWTRVKGKPYLRYSKPIEKPLVDERVYELIKLPNELQVLLVSDPTLDLAAVSLDVGVGHMSDPDDIPGMAHFCEHLSFMGSKEFPVENEYKKYIKTHGGSTNASTGTHRTVYHFRVEAPYLAGAIERFAGFFHSPLFKQECVEREVNAVNSENAKNQQNDGRRLYQLWKHLSDPSHPWNKFGCGSKDTLLKADTAENQQETRRRVVEWWEKNYCATRMKVAIVGADSLEKLAEMAYDNFSQVVNKNLGPCILTTSAPWSTSEPPQLIFARTVKDTQLLELKFPIPYQAPLYRTKPSRYISHLIGHEGPGSLFYWLHKQGLATALDCSLHTAGNGVSLLDVDISLTRAGLREYKRVLAALFHYLTLLPLALSQPHHFEENKRMTEIGFNYASKRSADVHARTLSHAMNDDYRREHILSRGALDWEFNQKDIEGVIQCLDKTKARVILAARDFDGVEVPTHWEKETWYGTEHIRGILDLESILPLSEAETVSLYLPEKNNYIPDNLNVERAIVEKPLTRPNLLKSTKKLTLWHKKDDQFWLPRGSITIRIESPLLAGSLTHVVQTRLYIELVKDALNGPTYAAELAGVSYSLGLSPDGITVQVSGYNDKLLDVLRMVLQHLCNLTVRKDRFMIALEKMKRSYDNAYLRESSLMVDLFLTQCTEEHLYTAPEKRKELEFASIEDLRVHGRRIFNAVYLTVLIHGNIPEDQAIVWASEIEEMYSTTAVVPSDQLSLRSLLLPSRCNYVLNSTVPNGEETNSAVSYFCRTGNVVDLKTRAFTSLLASMINEPFFHTTRTQEQLGYSVSCINWTETATVGLRFRIQSLKHPDYLESRIDAFVDSYAIKLKEMTTEEFETHKRGIVVKKRMKLMNLGEEYSRFWAHISSGYLDFEQAELDACEIESISLDSLVVFYNAYIHPSSPSRSKLTVRLISQAVVPEGQGTSVTIDQSVDYSIFDDVHQIRRNLKLSPAAMATGSPVY